MLPSISSRRRCLPAVNGDADMLRTTAAPARGELVDRIVMVAAPLPEIAIVPDVLADADADARAGDVEQLGAVVRLEVAVLVEDVVGRQQRLAEALLDAAAAQQHRAVEERPAFVGRIRLGQADQHRRQRPPRRARAPRPPPSCGARSRR